MQLSLRRVQSSVDAKPTALCLSSAPERSDRRYSIKSPIDGGRWGFVSTYTASKISISCRYPGRLAIFVVEADADNINVEIAQRVLRRKAVEGGRIHSESIKLVVKKLAAYRPVTVFKGIFESAANHPPGLRIADADNENPRERDRPYKGTLESYIGPRAPAGDVEQSAIPRVANTPADAGKPIDVTSQRQRRKWGQRNTLQGRGTQVFGTIDLGAGNVAFQSDDPVRLELPVEAGLSASHNAAAVALAYPETF